ncbi:MAG: hypothetical protein ABSD99_10700 [Candidatus Bathyarchaeia archaeon]
MAAPDQQLTKKLAEMKTFLERRLKQQEEEVGYLKSFLEVVDTLLAERSFRPVDIGSVTPTPPSKPQPTERTPSDNVPIMTTDGVRIASITIQANDLRVLPEPGINLDSNSPPLRSFLLAKVLEPMQSKDKEAATAGSLQPDNMLTYDVEQEEGRLKSIHVQNYGDDRRLLELKNAIRWTFRRMYEKTGAK